MHILEKIVRYKKKEVEAAKQQVSITQLEKSNYFDRTCNSYISRLGDDNSSGVIAEYKRKSPSRSNINLISNLDDVVNGYQQGGASAISILTDKYFFGGSNEYLTTARKLLPDMPLLRKEFIIDEYQIIEAKSIGADIILLICEILSASQALQLASLARSLGMEVLLEMHTADQIPKYNHDVSMVGVNNRDLRSFEVDYERSKKLYDQLPAQTFKIAESGLSDPDTCIMLYQHGFRGFLIGEQFMKQHDPGLACANFITDFSSKRNI